MSEADAKQLMLTECQMVYDGIVYLRIDSLEIRYDRTKRTFVLYLLLLDRNRNSVTRAPAEKCVPVPL
ncbi:MAG: hypothetical protein IJX39_00255 [Clostridia bacterium]|nr:hypothetical protein [Clostridia bacterium]